jgi:hypothetical protein
VIDERLTYALLTGTVVDAAAAAAPPRSTLCVNVLGIGAPPIAVDRVWARAYGPGGFVVVAEASAIPLSDASSSLPSPKHLAGTFDLSFTLSAFGYDDLTATVHCNHDALPIVPPAPYALAPLPFTLRGIATQGGLNPVPLAAANVTVAGTALATTTAADGTYVIAAVPAAPSITVNVSGSGNSTSTTVATTYPDPVLTVNFAF